MGAPCSWCASPRTDACAGAVEAQQEEEETAEVEHVGEELPPGHGIGEKGAEHGVRAAG